jgi:UDP-N-acetylglucosamine 1-carboxyvinyltransferase
MERLEITGGARLEGSVSVSGSKNATLAIMAASLAARSEVLLHNVAPIGDVLTMMEVLRHVGAEADFCGEDTVRIDATHLSNARAPYDLVKRMRASFTVLGPILTRLGEAHIPLPGGCDIGSRPVNFHLDGLEKLGVDLRLEHGWVEAQIRDLRGASIYLDYPSAGATSHLLSVAVLADGVTTIENAAQEPEVAELAAFLNQCGARIEGAGTPDIRIEGVKSLQGCEHRVVEDRMEAATFALAAAITGGDVWVEFPATWHMRPVLQKLRATGVQAHSNGHGFRVKSRRRPLATDIKTMPFPGFPTDVQQPMVALLSVADGTSVVTETVFERRFKYVEELRRMGADIRVDGSSAIVRGVPALQGASVTATDLRAGAALAVAALSAEAVTEISGVHHIDRGYCGFVEKLVSLGGQARRLAGAQRNIEACLA